MLVVALLIYLLIGTIVFYMTTKVSQEYGYVWSKKWFIICFVLISIAWPLVITKAIVLLLMKYDYKTIDETTTNLEEIGIIEKEES